MGSFFGDLFDFTFTRFITTKWVKLIFLVMLAVFGLQLVADVIASLAQMFGGDGISMKFVGLLILVASVVVFLVEVLFSRILLEIIVIFFRIEEHARSIANAGGGIAGPAAVSATPGAAAFPATQPGV
jgi:hypothetical protein